MRRSTILKSILLLCALVAGSSSVWADTYTTTFSRDNSKLKCTGDITYTTTVEPGSSDTSRGAQFGTSGTPAGEFTLTAGKSVSNITKVEVACCTAKSGAATVSVKVGEASLGTSKTISPNTTSADTYTFDGSTLSGIVKVAVNATSKAFYLKSITITYTSSGGGSSTVSVPTFSPTAGAVAAGTTIKLTQADADEIRYTIDGVTDPTKTTGTVYSTPITITKATTIKAIAVKGDNASSVATAAYTISVAAPTYNPESGSYLEGTEIALTSTGNTIYYNITTDGTDPTTPTNSSTEYTAPIVLSGGTNKIKAIAYDAYGNSSSVSQRTYTGIAPTTLPFSWAGTSNAGKEDLAAKAGVVLSLASDYSAQNAPYRLKFDGTSKYVMIFTNEKPEAVAFTAKIFEDVSTGSKMKVQASADGIEFTDIQEFTIKGAKDDTFEFITSNAFAANHRVIKLSLSYKDKNIGVGSISVSAEPISITPSKAMTTFCSTKALNFDGTELKAYVVSSVGTTAVLEEVTDVPAGTGLILVGEAGTSYNIPVGTATTLSETNKLVGVTVDTNISQNAPTEYDYVLSDGKFVRSANGTLPAGKAYLPASAVAGAPSLDIVFDGDNGSDNTTGISTIENGQLTIDNSKVYNLNGQRVAQPTKGLYIVNGRKVIVK